MVALLALEDVEVALGREAVDDAEEAMWQQRIEQISAFVDGYCDDCFEVVAGDTLRAQANAYGVIELGGGPVSQVTSVMWAGTTKPVTGSCYDGLETLYNLWPMAVVDIVYTHGWSAVPKDVKGVVLDALLALLGLAEQGSSGPIKQFTVGNVTEAYSFSKHQDGATKINVTVSGEVLNLYRKSMGTFQLVGGNHIPPWLEVPFQTFL